MPSTCAPVPIHAGPALVAGDIFYRAAIVLPWWRSMWVLFKRFSYKAPTPNRALTHVPRVLPLVGGPTASGMSAGMSAQFRRWMSASSLRPRPHSVGPTTATTVAIAHISIPPEIVLDRATPRAVPGLRYEIQGLSVGELGMDGPGKAIEAGIRPKWTRGPT